MYHIQTFNRIAEQGLNRFDSTYYRVGENIDKPDALLLRSQVLDNSSIPDSVKAVARAGAGTNNIPTQDLSERGIVVFNTPGANANAVKELVLAGMLLASRNIYQSIDFVKQLQGDDREINQQVEGGKKHFIGQELPYKRLAVIGLGAIGVEVANMALALGMEVVGYDPAISIERAWQLSAQVNCAQSLQEAVKGADFISIHVPAIPSTEGMINQDVLQNLKQVTLLNFARGSIVCQSSLLAALKDGQVKRYVTDFPSKSILGHEKVIALPHLGASTFEAEQNCAVMAANQLKDFLENGNVVNSINFPKAVLPNRQGNRLCIANRNIPNMVGQISAQLATRSLNIIELLNKSRGELAYTLIDVEGQVDEPLIKALSDIDGVLSVRLITG